LDRQRRIVSATVAIATVRLLRYDRLWERDSAMIPPLNIDGYLPAGIHQATLEEIAARFGAESEIRRVQMESLHWVVDLARRAGVTRIIVNGSFVTDKLEPNDVDCALLAAADYPREAAAAEELLAGLPFVELHILGPDRFDRFVQTIFGTDRALIPMGVIEILL
jgi:hypothetical protein